MKKDRDELVKMVFPKLRRLCEERGVNWSEVDLRWGIDTDDIIDEMQHERKVIDTCLQEIKDCHPYFIGLLGERYGYVPKHIDKDVLDKHPWVKAYSGYSITELEIMQGVLNDPKMAGHAFFYFRSKDYCDNLSEEQKPLFTEAVESYTHELPHEQAVQKAEQQKQKLQNLKDKIKSASESGFCYLSEDYANPDELVDIVYANFEKLVKRLFPQKNVYSVYDQDANEHTHYAQQYQRFFLPFSQIHKKLNTWLANSSTPLLLTGDSGCGKTAVLANWLLASNPDNTIVTSHFVGANQQSTDWAHMLRRLIVQLDDQFDENDLPVEPNKLRNLFAQKLHQKSLKKNILIVIDSLNQLEDKQGALDLVWLPERLPVNCKIVVSSLAGPPLEEWRKRHWREIQIKLLTPEQIEIFSQKYLKQLYGKEIKPEYLEKLKACEQARNPLFLLLLLEELRQIGEREILAHKLPEYLNAKGIPQLFQKILKRYTTDYAYGDASRIKRFYFYLCLCRRGLSESEVFDLLGSKKQKLPAIKWSAFYAAANYTLVNKSGLFTFSHDYFRSAVEQLLDKKPYYQKVMRLVLARYFKNRKMGSRQVEEYSWQLFKLKEWQELSNLMLDEQLLVKSWQHNPVDVKIYWTEIETHSRIKLVSAAKSVTDNPQIFSKSFLSILAFLLFDKNCYNESLSLHNFLYESLQKSGEDKDAAEHLRHIANIEYLLGHWQTALETYKKLAIFCNRINDKLGLQKSIGNQAVIAFRTGAYDSALALLATQEEICLQEDFHYDLIKCYGNRANTFHAMKEYDNAIFWHLKEEKKCKEEADTSRLQICYGNTAALFYDKKDFKQALEYHKKEQDICDLLDDRHGLQASLGNVGNIHYQLNNDDKALEYYQKQIELCREIHYPRGEQNALGNTALLYMKKNERTKARAALQQQKNICKKYNFTKDLLQCRIRLLLWLFK